MHGFNEIFGEEERGRGSDRLDFGAVRILS